MPRTPITDLVPGDRIRQGPVETVEITDVLQAPQGVYSYWRDGEIRPVSVTHEGQANVARKAPAWALREIREESPTVAASLRRQGAL